MRRLLKTLWRIGVVLGLLGSVLLLLYLLVLPGVVDSAIRDALADQGFDEADFVLESLSPTGIHLADFTLSADRRLTVDAIDVDYTISGLREGRVGEVRLTGLRFEVGFVDGEIDLGPLEDLPEGDGSGSGEVPIDRVVIRSSAVVVRESDGTRQLPLDGSIDFVSRDLLKARLETRVFDEPVLIQAEVRPEAGEIDGDAVLGEPGGDGARIEWSAADLGGEAERIRVRFDGSKGRLRTARGRAGITLEGLRVAGDVEIQGRERIAAVSLDLSARRVSRSRVAVTDAELSLKGEGADIRVTASAAHDGFTLDRLSVVLPARIDEIISEDLTANASFAAGGSLPASLRDAVLRGGLALDPDTTLRLEGSALIRPRSGRISDLLVALTLDAPTLAAVGPGLLAERLTAAAELTGDFDGKRAELSVLPGATFKAATLRLPAATIAIGVSLGEKATLSLPLGGDGAWSAYLPSIEVEAHGLEDGIEVGGFSLREAKSTAHLAVDADPERIRLALVGGALASVPRIEGPAASAGPLNLLVQNGPRGDIATLDLGSGALRVEGAARTVSAIDAEISGMTAKVRSVTVNAKIDASGNAPAAVSGRLEFDVARARHEALEIVLTDIGGILPFALSVGEDEDRGTIAVQTVIFRGHRLPPITGRVRRVGSAISLDASWPLTDIAVLAIKGETDLGRTLPSATIGISTPRFTIKRGDRLDRIIFAETGYHLAGELSADGELNFSGGRLDPRVNVTVADATVTGADDTLSIEGIRASVEFVALSPPRTAGGQRVSFRTGRIGELEIGDGSLLFRLEGPRSILVESARWRLGTTGRFLAHSFRVDPEEPDVDLDLFLEDLALADWLSLVTAEHASGEGRLYGRLPIRIRTKPRLKVTVGAGFLYALGGGTLKIPDAELVDRMLEENVPQLDGDVDYGKLVRQRIVESLKDFEFSVLRFDIHRRSGGLTLSVTANGRGRKVPQELNLTVNFNGFDALIAPALGMKLGIEHAREEAMKLFRKP